MFATLLSIHARTIREACSRDQLFHCDMSLAIYIDINARCLNGHWCAVQQNYRPADAEPYWPRARNGLELRKPILFLCWHVLFC